MVTQLHCLYFCTLILNDTDITAISYDELIYEPGFVLYKTNYDNYNYCNNTY